MTLGEGKRKVLMLLDEYSSGGELTVDEDIEKKMADFFDTAQKDMASFKRIIRTQEITEPEEDEEEAAAAAAEKTTFWGRIAQMFKDLWAAVTGLFGGKD